VAKETPVQQVPIQQAPVHVTINNTPPKAPEPIEGFDTTVPGGRFYVRRGSSAKLFLVDAHGEPIKDGVQQDEEVIARQIEEDNDLSKTRIDTQEA
jgi:hypothetical protein